MRHLTMQDMRDCIDDCIECAMICRETFAFCIATGGEAADAEHVKLLTDCAEFCQLGADTMIRRSEFRADVCRLVATVAKACAESCRHLNTPETILCAELCEECADSCETMAVSVTWTYRPKHAPQIVRREAMD